MTISLSFHRLFELWKNSPPKHRLPVVERFEKRIKANPYRLRPEELAALSNAGFPFFRRDVVWIRHYAELLAFTQEHGHALIPISQNRCPHTMWISDQRTRWRKGTLSPLRQRLLNRLKFVWNANEAIWKERLKALSDFMATNGHMRIPHYEPWYKLACWVSSCRARKRDLSAKKIRDLDRLGFIWDPFDEAWQSGLEELKQFIEENGHANVPASRSNRPKAAGFLLHSRKLFRYGKLDAERRKELESLGVVWNPKIDLWEERYRELCDVHRRLGHIRIPTYWAEDKRLERWLRRQRGRPHFLTEVQREKLLKLDAFIFEKLRPGMRDRLNQWPLVSKP